ENVGEAGGEVEAGARPAGSAAILEGGVAETVVGGALLLVLQDVVGLVDLLELLLGRRVTRIPVRVILHGQLSIGLLDFVGTGRAGDPELLVIVLLSHAVSVVPGGGRSAAGGAASPRRYGHLAALMVQP